MKIFTYPNGPYALKGIVTAKYCNVHIDIPPFEMGVENKTPEFLKMNPNGKVPTLWTPKGCIWESNSIARYIARMNLSTGLYGESAVETAQVDMWLDWTLTTLCEPIHSWIGPLFGHGQYNKGMETKAKESVKNALLLLNDYLMDRTYMVTEQVTLADIVIACQLLFGYEKLFEPKYREAFPNVTRWYLTVVNQNEFSSCYKIKPLCEKTEQYVPPKKEDKKEDKKVEKKTEKKVEEKPNDEEEKPKKRVNPLDLLPKPTMDLDNWKRTYSNFRENDFYGVMKLFYEQYHPEDYSLWLCDYKFDDENTVGFKTSNLVGGFIQRSDELRKYSFGNMVIMKKEGINHYYIKGAWLIRGSDIKPMLEANPDSEYYQWTKVDIKNEEQKQKLAHYWCASDKIDDYTVTETHIFK